MTTHTVHVPESALRDRRKMTAGQFLTEMKIYEDGATRAHLFGHTVTVKSAATETNTGRARFVSAPALFRHLETLRLSGQVVTGLYCKAWKLGPHGLAKLNLALTTYAVRKGGLTIVRHFLENQRHGKTAMRGSFDDLLSFLEIRPVFLPQAAQIDARSGHYVVSIPSCRLSTYVTRCFLTIVSHSPFLSSKT